MILLEKSSQQDLIKRRKSKMKLINIFVGIAIVASLSAILVIAVRMMNGYPLKDTVIVLSLAVLLVCPLTAGITIGKSEKNKKETHSGGSV
jgi:uncharacterized membrane protein